MADNTTYTRQERKNLFEKNGPRDKCYKSGNYADNKNRKTLSKLWHIEVN